MRVPAPLASAVAHPAARALAATWSWRMREPSAPGGGGDGPWRAVRPPLPLEPAVYVAWHEHLLPLALLHRDQGVTALVSRHRDGEILARVLRRMGYGTARGSSTRGGGPGLREMIEAGRAGTPLAFTPDGPRGPARRCKPGAVRAAAETGLPVVPLAASATRHRRLGSWDQFMVPAPGARVHVVRGDVLRVPGDAGAGGGADADAALEAWCERVGRSLETARRRAEGRTAARTAGSR